MATYSNPRTNGFRRRISTLFRYYVFTAEMAVFAMGALVVVGVSYLALEALGVFG